MAVFTHGVISHAHNLTPLTNFPTCFSNPIHKIPSHTQSRNFKPLFVSSPSSSSVAKSIPPVEPQDASDSGCGSSNSSWSEFAGKVSGEWDGYGADFSREGKPIELPECVVPEAFREWEVKVFDWQTQCPTLARQEELVLSYRSVKLLPTVGCEADAATVHSSDERILGGHANGALAAAFHRSGSYLSAWPLEDKSLELEHCLIHPSNPESRVRLIQTLGLEDTAITLKGIQVFSELWYGPFRNGDQLGGCAIRESGFASTDPLQASQVTRVWQSRQAVSIFKDSHQTVFQELTDGSPREILRDDCSLITLPRQLWCSLNKRENGETCAEVGWLLDSGSAISSRCIFASDGNIKEFAMGRDTAIAGTMDVHTTSYFPSTGNRSPGQMDSVDEQIDQLCAEIAYLRWLISNLNSTGHRSPRHIASVCARIDHLQAWNVALGAKLAQRRLPMSAFRSPTADPPATTSRPIDHKDPLLNVLFSDTPGDESFDADTYKAGPVFDTSDDEEEEEMDGHTLRDCPNNKRVLFSTTSDYESFDEDTPDTGPVFDAYGQEAEEEEMDNYICSSKDEQGNMPRSLVTRRILTAKEGTLLDQRANLFHTKCAVQGASFSVIIDSGRYCNISNTTVIHYSQFEMPPQPDIHKSCADRLLFARSREVSPIIQGRLPCLFLDPFACLLNVNSLVDLPSTVPTLLQERNADRHAVELEPKGLVWLHLCRDLFPLKRRRKWDASGIGPFQGIQRLGADAYRLILPDDYGAHPTFNVADLSPYTPPAFDDEDEAGTLRSQEGEIDSNMHMRVNQRPLMKRLKQRVKSCAYSELL